jgi:hypothetical protein
MEIKNKRTIHRPSATAVYKEYSANEIKDLKVIYIYT